MLGNGGEEETRSSLCDDDVGGKRKRPRGGEEHLKVIRHRDGGLDAAERTR